MATSSTAPGPLTWKIRLFLVACGLLPILFLELGLRLAGFGGAQPLLLPLIPAAQSRAGPKPAVYEVNPKLAEIFFSRRTGEGGLMVGGHRRETVELPKPAGSFRILFVGASTVEGFPLPANLSSSRFLERMIASRLPAERRVEVLNLGVTAIASFPVWKITEDALARLDPDLLLVYAGQNEFFGASGVASMQSMGTGPRQMAWLYRLRRTALMQGIVALLNPVPATGPKRDRSLLQVMAGIDQVEPGGDLHRAARRTLETHLEAIVHAARQRSVPVVLSTLASLERDLAPIGWYEGDLLESEREDFRRRLEAARARLADRPAEASRALTELTDLTEAAPRHAGAAYFRGQALAGLGRSAEAAEAFGLARDLDAMPWRAPRSQSTAIRGLAARLAVPLADVEAAFAARAGGATTRELFYDHVHPSLEGQALLARTLFETLSDEGLLPQKAEDAGALPDWREIAADLGAHPLEHFLVVHKMTTLFNAPPIGSHNGKAAARFSTLLERLRRSADPVDREAVRRWEEASAEVGFALPISFFGGAAALAAGELARARVYLRGAVGNAYPWSDERCAAYLLEVIALLRGGETAIAEERLGRYLEEARVVSSFEGQPTALQARALAGLLALAGRIEEARAQEEIVQRELDSAPPWTRAFLSQLPAPERLLLERVRLEGDDDGGGLAVNDR